MKDIEQKIEQTKAKIERLEKILNAETVPGWTVTGGAKRSSSLIKALDRQNEKRINAAVAWKQATDDLRHLEAQLASFQAGETHANGQARKDAPSRVKRKQAEDIYSEFVKSQLAPGTPAALIENSDNLITIVRVNKTTATDEHGTKWKFHELIPVNSQGNAMKEEELRQAMRAWRQKNDPTE